MIELKNLQEILNINIIEVPINKRCIRRYYHKN